MRSSRKIRKIAIEGPERFIRSRKQIHQKIQFRRRKLGYRKSEKAVNYQGYEL